MNAFPSSFSPTAPPLLSLPPPPHQLKAAVWVVKLDWMHEPRRYCRGAGVYFPCVFFACVMNSVYIQNSSRADPSCFLLYSGTHREGASLS